MNLDELLEGCPNALIADALIITNNKVNSPLYNNIVCSISGGSDSDVMLDLCHRVDPDGKVKYVFFNTGLEYKATLEHLDFLQKKYNITIDRRKAIKPIPTSCKQYGVPFISKYISEMIYRLQRHNFKWEDKPYEELIKKYPKCKSALQWWCNCKTPTKDGKPGTLNISSCKYLKEFMITHPPTFKISQKCCTYAKKEVAKIYLREKKADLQMIGIRQAEGEYDPSDIKIALRLVKTTRQIIIDQFFGLQTT